MKQKVESCWEKENWTAYKECYNIDQFAVGDDEGRIEVRDSRAGLPTVRVMTSNGKWVYLHSSVDPVQEARKIAASVASDAGKLVVVYGFALGYLVEALLEAVDNKNPIFVIEPDCDLFCAAMKARCLRHIICSDRVYILVSNSASKIKATFSAVYDAAKYNDVITTGMPGHQTVYADFYPKAITYIKDVVNEKLLSLVTMIKMGPNFIENTLLNLASYCTHPGVSALFDRLAGMPAIIVSAGPSLNKNIHLLQEAKGKAAIFAVGTAVKSLKKQGIEPDFIVSIDPHPLNYEHFKDVDTGEAALVAEIQSHHMIMENYRGPIFVSGNMPVLKWFGKTIENKGIIESGGSVANSAMTAAYKMGADPIILVGQDLAYSRDGHSHAAGTNYEDKVYSGGVDINYFYVKANDGGQLLTDRAFYQFLAFFQLWIEKFPRREYINATEGGAYIQGTKVMTLREVLDTYCQRSIDVQAPIREAQHSFQRPELHAIQEIVELRQKDISNTIAEAQRAIRYLKQLQHACENRQGKKMQQYLKAVNKIYKKFEADKDIRGVAEWFVTRDIHGVFSRTHAAERSEEDDFNAAIADYNLYYEKVLEGTESLKGLLDACSKKIRRKMGND